MSQAPHRDHLTLAQKVFHKRTGYLPREAWVVWGDLKSEAELYRLPKALSRLELLNEASPSINGWGQGKLVEGMRGEVKPEGPATSQWLGAPPTTVVNMLGGQAQPADPNGHTRPKPGILARLRGKT